MYYPIQIPYMLNQKYNETICYKEETVPRLAGFVICFWEMTQRTAQKSEIENVIVTDACIDLVVDYDGRQIGFSGMSKTNFHYKIDSSSRYMGARLAPGAFYQLTGTPASAAMDAFLPLTDAEFDLGAFFSLSFAGAKARFVEYTAKLIGGRRPDFFTLLFDALFDAPPASAAELYKRLNFSPRQCQRIFLKRFGLTPQKALCVLRFQRCLEMLAGGKSTPGDILNIVGYYDQPHFIKDFKRNLGLTPFELARKYRS